MVERIERDGVMLALIVRAGYSEPGITFFTPPEFSQQLGSMRHPAGWSIAPHVHQPIPRQTLTTQEVLFVQEGVLRVDLYDDDCVYQESRLLQAGDVILLCRGGHGFEVIEPVRMIEVKQGPFAGEVDKRRFEPVDRERIRLA